MTQTGLYRLISLGGALICAGAMGFALYVEHVLGLEPCPMCVFQRVAMIAAGVFFLVGAVHGPVAWGQFVHAGLAGASALLGLGIAGRHVWLQSLPPDQVPACGPALDYLVDMMPLWEVVQTILRGDGNCALIVWEFMGLSLPSWTGIGFFALALWALLSVLAPRLLQQRLSKA